MDKTEEEKPIEDDFLAIQRKIDDEIKPVSEKDIKRKIAVEEYLPEPPVEKSIPYPLSAAEKSKETFTAENNTATNEAWLFGIISENKLSK